MCDAFPSLRMEMTAEARAERRDEQTTNGALHRRLPFCSSGVSPSQPGALFHGFRCVLHRLIPIDLVGVDPIECGRVGEKLKEKRHEPVPKLHLDRFGQDLLPTQAAPILDHALDARSTKALIGRKGERVILSVSQAL